MPRQKKPIVVYFWNTPNGQKISIMLEEVGLPYELRAVDINAGAQFAPAFLEISPNNKIPAIVDPDGPGGKPVSIFESGAILSYLGDKTGKFIGETPVERIAINEWLFWQVGGLGPMSGQANHFRNAAPVKIDYGVERYTSEVTRLFGVLERQLEGRAFIAGPYSIADIATWPWVRLWKGLGQDIEAYPKLRAWLERVGARDAVGRGMAAGKALAKIAPHTVVPPPTATQSR
ncbi:MAG: glutathione S-transferase N-terminal domain-containing protein [Hyphomicrobium sp.]|nr:glutathione S-transferase N-terminal domain-containing protein [Hyphomicrobium sp.]